MKQHSLNEQKITEILQNYCKTTQGCVWTVQKGRGKKDGCRSGIAQTNCQVLIFPPQLMHRKNFCILSHGGPHASSLAPTHSFPPGPTSQQPPPKPSSCCYIGLVLLPPSISLNYSFPSLFPLCALEFTFPCHITLQIPFFAGICLPHLQRCSLLANYLAQQQVLPCQLCPKHLLVAAGWPTTATCLIICRLKLSL